MLQLAAAASAATEDSSAAAAATATAAAGPAFAAPSGASSSLVPSSSSHSGGLVFADYISCVLNGLMYLFKVPKQIKLSLVLIIGLMNLFIVRFVETSIQTPYHAMYFCFPLSPPLSSV